MVMATVERGTRIASGGGRWVSRVPVLLRRVRRAGAGEMNERRRPSRPSPPIPHAAEYLAYPNECVRSERTTQGNMVETELVGPF